jgi:hypothetical protein
VNGGIDKLQQRNPALLSGGRATQSQFEPFGGLRVHGVENRFMIVWWKVDQVEIF